MVIKRVSTADQHTVNSVSINPARARLVALWVMWVISALAMPRSGWSAEHDFARVLADLRQPEQMMTSFGHLRNATVQQIADSILILERNGRFGEAQELRRQFVEGLVGIDPHYRDRTNQRVDEHSLTLKQLREELARQNDQFLEMMRQGHPRSDTQRHEYQSVVDQILAAAGHPVAAPEPPVESRRELLESMIQQRTRVPR
jgi:hypothetical protein